MTQPNVSVPGNGAPATGPDGQPPNTQQQQQGGRPEGLPPNVVERSYFDQQINEERAKRQRQREEYEAKIAEYEAKIAGGNGQPKPPKVEPPVDQKLAEIERRLDERDKQAQKREFAEAVLSRVPEGNKAAAQDALDAMLYRGEIDLSSGVEAAAEKAVTTLSQRRAGLFVDPSAKGPRPAPQRKPNGEVDWSVYTHPSQVPKDLIGQVPPTEWARIRGGTPSSSAPNI